MNILVTGAAGFVGKHVMGAASNRGIKAIGVDVGPGWPTMGNVYSSDFHLVIPEGCDCIVHLAGLSTEKMCRENPHTAYLTNVVGTLRVLEAAKHQGVKHFVFASAEYVYGDWRGVQPLVESMAASLEELDNHYAITKLIGEKLVRMSGIPSAILRFGMAYGKRVTNLSIAEKIARCKALDQPLGKGGSMLSLRRPVHIDDLAAGIVLAVEKRAEGTFNLTGDLALTLHDMCSAIGFTRWEEETARPSQRNAINTKAKNVLGWHPQVQFDKGMLELVEYYRGQP